MLFLWEENIYYVSIVHKVDDNHCPVYVSLDPHTHTGIFKKFNSKSKTVTTYIFKPGLLLYQKQMKDNPISVGISITYHIQRDERSKTV